MGLLGSEPVTYQVQEDKQIPRYDKRSAASRGLVYLLDFVLLCLSKSEILQLIQ
jgi:hypothetical protein